MILNIWVFFFKNKVYFLFLLFMCFIVYNKVVFIWGMYINIKENVLNYVCMYYLNVICVYLIFI